MIHGSVWHHKHQFLLVKLVMNQKHCTVVLHDSLTFKLISSSAGKAPNMRVQIHSVVLGYTIYLFIYLLLHL